MANYMGRKRGGMMGAAGMPARPKPAGMQQRGAARSAMPSAGQAMRSQRTGMMGATGPQSGLSNRMGQMVAQARYGAPGGMRGAMRPAGGAVMGRGGASAMRNMLNRAGRTGGRRG